MAFARKNLYFLTVRNVNHNDNSDHPAKNFYNTICILRGPLFNCNYINNDNARNMTYNKPFLLWTPEVKTETSKFE